MSLAFIAQLFTWGEALITKGRPLIEDVIAAFAKHNVESDAEMVLAAAADAKDRRERREAIIAAAATIAAAAGDGE